MPKKTDPNTFANAAPNTLFTSSVYKAGAAKSDEPVGSRLAADANLLDSRPWGDKRRIHGRVIATYRTRLVAGVGFDAFTSCRCAEVEDVFAEGWINFEGDGLGATGAINWLLGR